MIVLDVDLLSRAVLRGKLFAVFLFLGGRPGALPLIERGLVLPPRHGVGELVPVVGFKWLHLSLLTSVFCGSSSRRLPLSFPRPVLRQPVRRAPRVPAR